MVLPLAALLPIAGATLGGISGYKQSGGDIGAAALGSGLGALSMGGLAAPLKALGGRMAGTALGARIAPEAYKAQQAASALMGGAGIKGAQAAAQQAGMAAPMIQQMAGSGVLAKALTGLAAGGAALTLPAAAAGLAAGAAGPVRSAASRGGQAAAGLAGYPSGYGEEAQYGGAALPPGMGPFGPVDAYGTPLDIALPTGQAAGRRLEYAKTIEQQRDAMRMLLPELYKASEARSKSEFQRQLAAAGVRQNILTSANMLERSQQAAQQMGLTAASQAGQALTQQYQYS